MSIRQKQVAARKGQILDTADALVRQTGNADFSMRVLADQAGVSLATPYNLFGSKEALLYELLARAINHLIASVPVDNSDDPIEQVVQAAERAANIILADPQLLRPLYQFLLGVPDVMSRPQLMKTSLKFWRSTLNEAVDAGILRDDADCTTLAFSLMAHFIGFLELWVHSDIGDREFAARVVHGFVHQLWPLAHGKHLKQLKKRLAQAKQNLDRVLSR